MMKEKDMVSDILSGTKAGLASYAKMIVECGDQNLRQTFQQMRDADEQFQYDLYKVANEKGYYTPAASADNGERARVKASLSMS